MGELGLVELRQALTRDLILAKYSLFFKKKDVDIIIFFFAILPALQCCSEVNFYVYWSCYARIEYDGS